jgi:protein-S-isoprenylcysteine O-methyltransferase Ste14
MLNQTGFVWILLSVALYGLIHSVLAGLLFKQWVRRWIGDHQYHRFYRLFFSLQAALLFLPILILVAALPDQILYRIPMPWVLLTSLIQIAAAGAILHSVMLTGAMRFVGFQQAVDPASAQHSLPLVRRGLYRYVRHPLYTCTFLAIWLMPVMSWNIVALNIGITVYTLIGAVLEERKLAEEFGPAYEAYRKNTPFFVPGLNLNKNKL